MALDPIPIKELRRKNQESPARRDKENKENRT